MIKKYSIFINERLGVPEGNIESAEILYNFILDKLKEKGNNIISKDDIVESNSDLNIIPLGNIPSIKIGKLEFKNINISIDPFFNEEEFIILGMSVSVSHSDVKKTHLTYDKENISDIHIMIKYAVIENKTKYSDIYNDFANNKSKKIGPLSHELKHAYDKYMLGKEMFGDISSYSTFSKRRFGIDSIDKFIYLLYLTSKTESLVRSSEIAAQIKSLDISKDEFKEFLKETSLYKQIKMAKNFSFDKMKNDLYQETDMIRLRLNQNGIEAPENEDDLVDFILELTYRNIIGGSIETLINIMDINNPIRIMLNLIKKEEKDYFNKYIKKISFKNKEKYFEYCQKMINFEANKVLKKISKLYDMCKDKEVNKLQNKITDKSIINQKEYDKYVADKSIKSYESLFLKKDKKN